MKHIPLIALLILTGCGGSGDSSTGSGQLVGSSPTGKDVDYSICPQTQGVTWDAYVTKHQQFHGRVGWHDSPETEAWHDKHGRAECFPNRPRRYYQYSIGTH